MDALKGMLSPPVSSDDLQKLGDDAQQLLKDFGILYCKNVGLALFDKANEEATNGSQWKLEHRNFDSVGTTRQKSMTGCCYVRAGEGPGSLGKWKKLFVVETHDSNVEVYTSEQEYTSKKNPKYVINMAGYEVVENVGEHFKRELQEITTGLDKELAKFLTEKFPTKCWALCHQQRKNYIFHMVDPKGSSNLTSEQDGVRENWIAVMNRCLKTNKPRDLTKVLGMVFQSTCEDMTEKNENLKGWKDDGKEDEMLVDMLMEALLPDLSKKIIEALKGPLRIRLKIWFKTRGLILQTLKTVVGNGWKLLQQQAGKVMDELEPKISKVLTKVIEFKNKTMDGMKKKICSKMEPVLQKHVTPHIRKLLDAFEKPLSNGFQLGRTILSKHVVMEKLPDDKTKRNQILDDIPRNEQYVKGMIQTTYELTESLRQLEEILPRDVSECLDVEVLRGDAERLLLETLDAAVYTIEVKLDRRSPKNSVKDEVLQDYDADILPSKCQYTVGAIVHVLVAVVKKAASPLTEPLVEQFNSSVPDEVKTFVDIEKILDALIELLVGEPVKVVLEAMYPKQTNGQRGSSPVLNDQRGSSGAPRMSNNRTSNGLTEEDQPIVCEVDDAFEFSTQSESIYENERFDLNDIQPPPRPPRSSTGSIQLGTNFRIPRPRHDEGSDQRQWDGSIADLAKWTGDKIKGRQIMNSLSMHEGAYMIRWPTDGTDLTLSVICVGKITEFKIIRDKSGKFVMSKPFRSLDDMIQYFTSNDLPHRSTQLTKSYWELTTLPLPIAVHRYLT